MNLAQTVSRIPQGTLWHNFVVRQNPPAPVSLTATSASQTLTLFGLPARHVVCGVRVQLITRFAAVGMSSCQVIVGTAGAGNYYAPAFECVQTVSPTSFMYWSPFAMYTASAHDITATFTATGAQLSLLTAGELHIGILYRPL